MLKKSLLGLFTLSLLGRAGEADNKTADQTNTEQIVERQLAGGWSNTEVTPEIEKILDFVLMQMNTAAKLDKIVAVKTQTVKGRNFDITFDLDNKERWHTIVYRDLDGKLSITQVAKKLK